MKCSTCGGFYNQQCGHWPKCHPADPEPVPLDPLEAGFRLALCFILGAIFVALTLIYWRLP